MFIRALFSAHCRLCGQFNKLCSLYCNTALVLCNTLLCPSCSVCLDISLKLSLRSAPQLHLAGSTSRSLQKRRKTFKSLLWLNTDDNNCHTRK